MIQRIQTVYLLLAIVALVICMLLPVGTFVIPRMGAVMEFMNTGVRINGEMQDVSPWGLFAILLLSSVIGLATIFLFKNRMLQIRMTVFSSILLIGYYLTFIIFAFTLKNRFDAQYEVAWAICLPLVAIILNYLAIRAIGKDEVMVKAADRLR